MDDHQARIQREEEERHRKERARYLTSNICSETEFLPRDFNAKAHDLLATAWSLDPTAVRPGSPSSCQCHAIPPLPF